MHGWIVIDKPVGPGSTPVVSAVKRALRAGGYPRCKVGHGGTLDPLASGVLPVAVGEATKLAGRMLDADKAYDFTIAFGAETDTLDLEGAVIATSDVRPTMADIDAVLPRFTGAIAQTPPAYSAIRIDGARAYDRARAGETVTVPERSVIVHSLAVAHPPTPSRTREEEPDPNPPLPLGGGERGMGARSPTEPPALPLPLAGGGWGVGTRSLAEALTQVTLSARVSKGTYIRSLARDVARALGTVGHVTMLRRTKAGPFTLAPAISLDNLSELGQCRRLEDVTLPLTAGLDDIPALPVTPDQARALREGRKLVGIAAPPGLCLAMERDVPVALVRQDEGGMRVVRGFNL